MRIHAPVRQRPMSRARGAALKRADSRLESADSSVRERNMGPLPRLAPFEMRARTRVAGTHQKRPPCTPVESFVLPARELDFQTSRNIRLREIPMGRAHHAGSQHRSHIQHPFHVLHACPTQPQTPISQTTQHNPPRASMATRGQAWPRASDPHTDQLRAPRRRAHASQITKSRAGPRPAATHKPASHPMPVHATPMAAWPSPRTRDHACCPAALLPCCPAALLPRSTHSAGIVCLVFFDFS